MQEDKSEDTRRDAPEGEERGLAQDLGNHALDSGVKTFGATVGVLAAKDLYGKVKETVRPKDDAPKK